MARTSVRQIIRSGTLTRHELTPGQSIVLLALADRADATGESFPSQETLALDLGMSRLGIRKCIDVLVDKHLVEIVEKGGPRRSTRYRITVPSYLRATL
ncbi:helix-turn-helix domain-containing protein [Microbacterium sp. P26]|uniref:helix-turn-helix domain-containing protein n=1 Tax=Microbacterium TaxID=33882 RepID=UPI00203CA1C4|nr:helix-turn-helix domain-containing protein [Microbacterium sp. P26]MCM3500625.1 helix-turn-helix domain-containing protein [Microbacterium sp. P26]